MRNISAILIIGLVCFFIYSLIDNTPNCYSVAKNHNISFSKGEKLTYQMRYKAVRVGKSILTFHGEKDMGDRKVYHITFSTRLAALTDYEDLYADKDTFLPLLVNRTIKKFGTFTTKIKETYNQDDFRVDISKKSLLGSEEFSIEKDSVLHNAILLTYYYRSKKSFSGDENAKISLPTADFEITFQGTETIETPIGDYNAYIFSSSPSKFKFWLSTDDDRIPLKIENPTQLGYSLIIEDIAWE